MDTAVLAVPAVVALALPLGVRVDLALAVAGAGVRAALHGAVATVPAGDAEAGAVLALAVLVAARVALLQVAELARPAGQAVAGVVDAVAMGAAVQVAELCFFVFGWRFLISNGFGWISFFFARTRLTLVSGCLSCNGSSEVEGSWTVGLILT